MKYFCDNCKKYLRINNVDQKKYYLYCNSCLLTVNKCSKTKCKKSFLLKDADLVNLKIIYLKNCSFQFYNYDDINQLIVNKYGSLDKLNNIKKQRSKRRKERKNIRYNELCKALEYNKLEFKNYGDCYSYIETGKPDIETVIQRQLSKQKEINQRRQELSDELYKVDIPLDETIDSCYAYIHGLGDEPIGSIVTKIQIEYFLKNHTDYEQLCKIYSKDIAQNISIKRYSKKNSVQNIPPAVQQIEEKKFQINFS